MNFLIILALIGLLFLYGKWLVNAIRDLIPKIKVKLSELNQRTKNANNNNEKN